MTGSKLSVGSTNVARVHGLVDQLGEFQNNAIVTLEDLKTLEGSAVTGLALPLTLDYVTGSNGNYEGQISHTIEFLASKRYRATFLAIGSQGYRRQWTEDVRAVNSEA